MNTTTLSNPIHKMFAFAIAAALTFAIISATPSQAMADDDQQIKDYLERHELQAAPKTECEQKIKQPANSICVRVKFPPGATVFWLVIGPDHEQTEPGHQS